MTEGSVSLKALLKSQYHPTYATKGGFHFTSLHCLHLQTASSSLHITSAVLKIRYVITAKGEQYPPPKTSQLSLLSDSRGNQDSSENSEYLGFSSVKCTGKWLFKASMLG